MEMRILRHTRTIMDGSLMRNFGHLLGATRTAHKSTIYIRSKLHGRTYYDTADTHHEENPRRPVIRNCMGQGATKKFHEIARARDCADHHRTCLSARHYFLVKNIHCTSLYRRSSARTLPTPSGNTSSPKECRAWRGGNKSGVFINPRSIDQSDTYNARCSPIHEQPHTT